MKINHDITLKKYRAAYKERVKKKDKNKWWGYYVNRPLAVYPTWLFLKLNLSANIASWVSGIMVIIGAALLATGEYWTMIAGSVVISMWLVFDSVDGSIARYYSQCSKYGDFLDTIAGYLLISTVFFSVGIGTFYRGGSPVYIILGAGASIAGIFPRLVYQKILYYLDTNVNQHDILGSKRDNKKGLPLVLVLIARNLSDIGSLMLPLLLLFTILGLQHYWLIFYFAINLAIAVASTRKFMKYIRVNCG